MLYRLAAFSNDPEGGNPAGVWIGEELPSTEEMQQIAAEVGYSETAFISPRTGEKRTVRFFSPKAEVSFCGHATIASGVALGMRDGVGLYQFDTLVGTVPVAVSEKDGEFSAELRSVDPTTMEVSEELLSEALIALGWEASELDPAIPVSKAYAGAWHLVVAAGSRERLGSLDYDFGALKDLMLREDLTTVQLVWRENENTFHSRNPFPVGGVVEDPATGAAAAALGGYLRSAALIAVPAEVTVLQGKDMGRPSTLRVEIPAEGGISVSGHAVSI